MEIYNMPIEWLISIIGLVVITYFIVRPKHKPSEEDKLTEEVQVEGLPPRFPPDGGRYIP